MLRLLPLVLLLLACLLLPLLGYGEDLSERLRVCQEKGDAEARLDCYDALAAAVVVPEAEAAESLPETSAADELAGQNAETQVETKASVTEQAAQGSGVAAATGAATTESAAEEMASQAEDEFGRPQVKKVPESILAEISAIDKTAYGKLVLSLSNGQIWRQLDSKRTTLRPGDKVRISSAVSGSFLLSKASGGTSIRVRRIDS